MSGEVVICRIALALFDPQGGLQWFIPLESQEAVKLISLLWKKRGSSAQSIRLPEFESPAASWRWVSFLRDGRIYRRFRLPLMALPGLWGAAWETRGKWRARHYVMELEETGEDSWIYRKRKRKGRPSPSPSLKDRPF